MRSLGPLPVAIVSPKFMEGGREGIRLGEQAELSWGPAQASTPGRLPQ